MNKFLALVVVILIPVTFVVNNKTEEVAGLVLDKYNLELAVREEEKEEKAQVLISNNKDKSDPFYMDLEDYVIGVVAGEMPASFNMEALKAQAVAARTFAMYKSKNNTNYVLSTTINDQVYLSILDMQKKWGNDFEHYYNRVKEAVIATEGEVVTYNGDIIIAYYFAISNGYTDSASAVFKEDRDYLVSVDSSWDKAYQSYTSKRVMDRNTFCNKLNISCGTINISNIVRADNNYVRSININNVKFTGLDIFNKLALKSTDFKISVDDKNVTITTYGFGHGVGMSQYGAQGMAQKGYNYQEILKHYYKNTEVTKI